MGFLPWRKNEKPEKVSDVVYVCKEVQEVGCKLEGSLNRLESLITMIGGRGKVEAIDKPSLPTSTEV